MKEYKFTDLRLEGAFLIDYFSIGDNRGGFSKIFEKEIYSKMGIDFSIDEVFVSFSKKNVIRGMHFQTNDPQAKLVCVPKGKVFDVIVDLRPQSKTFKMWEGYELSDMNHRALFVPKGFAHGFVALENDTIMMYQCDGKYDHETDTGIMFNDPELGIEWPIDLKNTINSQRDLCLQSFKEYCNKFML